MVQIFRLFTSDSSARPSHWLCASCSTKDEDSCIILMRFHHPFVLHLVIFLYSIVVVANDWVPESIEQQGALEVGLESYYLPDL